MLNDISEANFDARESYDGVVGTVYSWDELAAGILTANLGACRPLVAIVLAALQADLCLKSVMIDCDEEVTEDGWVRQTRDGREHTNSAAQLTLYMRYTDDYADAGYAHYDALQPRAVLVKGDLPPAPPSGNGPKMTKTMKKTVKKKKKPKKKK